MKETVIVDIDQLKRKIVARTHHAGAEHVAQQIKGAVAAEAQGGGGRDEGERFRGQFRSTIKRTCFDDRVNEGRSLLWSGLEIVSMSRL